MSAKWKAKVWLLHGFNTRDDGANTVAKLIPFFEAKDIEAKVFRYGWLGLVGVRYFDSRFARLLCDAADEGDYVLGHSNGCCIAHLASQMGCQFKRMCYINPALDNDEPLAKQIEGLDVWFSASDTPVALAKLLPWHRWGNMGAVGYRGTWDVRVRNFDKEYGFPVSSRAHSDVFEPDKLKYFAPLIVDSLLS